MSLGPDAPVVAWGDRYDVFFSYSTDPDYALARSLESFLESFHNTPTPLDLVLRPLRVCVDGSDFSRASPATPEGDEDLVFATIRYYLERSRHLLVLCSRNSRRSPWCQRELDWFLAHRNPDDVLLAVTEGADPITSPEEVFLPQVIERGLHRRIWYDLRAIRPAATSWTKVRDFDDNRLRLAADLLGLSPGDVQPHWYRAQRDAEERERERRAIDASRQLAKQARDLLGSDPMLACLLAATAWQMSPTIDAQGALIELLVRAGRLVRQLPLHVAVVVGVQFLLDGSRLISVDAAGAVRISDVLSGALIEALDVSEPVVCLAVAPDERRLALGTASAIRLYDLNPLRPSSILGGHTGKVHSLAFDASSALLVSAGQDKTIRIWAVDPARETRPPIQAGASRVVFASDARTLIVARSELNVFVEGRLPANTIYFYDLDSDTTRPEELALESPIESFEVDVRRQLLLSTDWERPKLWRLSSAKEVEPSPFAASTRSPAIALARGGDIAATTGLSDHVGAVEPTITAWELEHGTPLGPSFGLHSDIVASMDISTGRWLATGGRDGRVFVWDLARETNLWADIAIHDALGSGLVSRDDRCVLTWNVHGAVLWNLATGNAERSLEMPDPAILIRHVDLHNDGDTALISASDGSLALCSLSRGETLATAKDRGFARARFHPVDDTLATVVSDSATHRIELRKATNLDHVIARRDVDERPDLLHYQVDGSTLVAVMGKALAILNAADLTLRGSLELGALIGGVDFGADGTLLVGTRDGDLVVVDVEAAQVEQRYDRLMEHCSGLSVRSDGRLMAAIDKGCLSFWDLPQRARVWQGPPARGRRVQFLHGDSRLVWIDDAKVRLWDTSVESWAGKALRIANRTLAGREWIQYLPDHAPPGEGGSGESVMELPRLWSWEADRQRRVRDQEARQWWDASTEQRRLVRAEAERQRQAGFDFAARGETRDAIAAFSEAARAYRELSASLDLADVLFAKGSALVRAGEGAAALDEFGAAHELYGRELAQRAETRVYYRVREPQAEELRALRGAAGVMNDTAVVLFRDERTLDASLAYSKSVGYREQALALADSEDDRCELALTLLNRAAVSEQTEQLDAAIADSERALEITRQLVEARPDADRVDQMMRALDASGRALASGGRPLEAAERHAGSAHWARTRFGDSGDRELLGRAGTALRKRAECLAAAERCDGAIESFSESIRTLSDVVAGGCSEWRVELAESLRARARCYRTLARREDAIRDGERAIVLLEVASGGPFDDELASTWFDQCFLLDEIERRDDALHAALQCVRCARRSLDPGVTSELLACYLLTLSRLQRSTDAQAAEASASEAVASHQESFASTPNAHTAAGLARALRARGLAREARDDWSGAEADYREAVQHLEAAANLVIPANRRELYGFTAILWNDVAWLLVTRFPERSVEARRHALRALRLDRSRHEYFDTLAVAHAQLGDFKRAQRWVATAIRRAPAARVAELERRRAAFELGQLAPDLCCATSRTGAPSGASPADFSAAPSRGPAQALPAADLAGEEPTRPT